MPFARDEFQPAAMRQYFEEREAAAELKARVLTSFMPNDVTYDMDFTYLIAEKKLGEMADIIGWDAATPLRGREAVKEMTASVIKAAHAFQIKEKDLLHYNRPRALGELQKALDHIYDQADALNDGLDDLRDYNRAQAMYNGELNYTNPNLKDGRIFVRWAIPAENKIVSSIPWSDPVNSVPLDDMEVAHTQFRAANNNTSASVTHMTTRKWRQVVKSNQVRANIFGPNSGNQQMINDQMVRTLISELGLPPILINDEVVNKDGQIIQLLSDDKFVMTAAEVGSYMIGPTVESDYEPERFIKTEKQEDPPIQKMRMGEAGFPVLTDVKGIVITEA